MKYKEAAEILGITEPAYFNRRDISEQLMRAMPASVPDLTKKLPFSHRAIKRALHELKAMGWVHVGSWKRSECRGMFQAVYRAGPGKNKPCTLEAIPFSECRANWRARARKEGRWDFMLAARRTKSKVKKIIKSGRPATPFDALFGK